MKKPAFYFAIFFLAIGLAYPCSACTTFVLRDGTVILFARNLDWYWGDGFIVVNQKGIEKTAFVIPPEKPARWTSKYGSVTFNQFGREMPYGGINETGLVVEQMMLIESKYPNSDQRPAVNMLQWIQYQLDNCRTVDEVLATDEIVRHEAPVGAQKIHYLVCDASGDTAAIEFLDGKMVYHRQSPRVLANDTYQRSMKFRESYAAANGANTAPDGYQSLHRFARAANCAVDFQSKSASADRKYAFHNLDEVAQGQDTVWSIVYDVSNRKVFYRSRDNRELRWFSLGDFDYAPTSTPVFLDINAPGSGHIASEFRELTDQRHQEYLFGFFGKKDVKEKLGNLMPLAYALNATVKSYRPKDDN